MLNLQQLKYFYIICENDCNLTEAADKLFISQSTLSETIKKLEDENKINLFKRHKQRLYLTYEGELFLQIVSELLTAEVKCRRQIESISSEYKITVGVPPMIGTIILPKFYEMNNAMDLNSVYNFKLFEYTTPECVDRLNNQLLDFAFVATNNIDKNDFDYKVILNTELVFVTHIDNDLSKIKFLDLASFDESTPLVLLKQNSFVSNLVYKMFNEKNKKPNIIFHTNQVKTLLEMVKMHIASTFVFRELTTNEDLCKNIKVIDAPKIELAVIWEKNKILNDKEIKFLNSF